MEQRLPTGIPGLDEILLGGLISQSTYLLAGRAGSGKTVFAMQWLLEGVRRNERTLFLTLTEPAAQIRRNLSLFGWTLDGIEVVDLAPTSEEAAVISEYKVFAPSEVEQNGVWNAVYQTIREQRPQRLVIDSVTQVRYLSLDEYQFRNKMLSLVRFLNESGCTSLLLFESAELERETALALAVDGMLRLRNEVSASSVIDLRSLQIEKFRGSGFMSGLHPLRIGSQGIEIFPHRIEPVGRVPPVGPPLTTNIRLLDELLGGGIERGTTTIITGPSGAGKSTLGTLFLLAGIASGQRSILFTFEEPVELILTRCRGIGLPLEPLLEAGTLRIVRMNPLEQYPDEFLGQVRAAVEEEGFQIVMIDSLRGYELEMEQFGSSLAHIHNLVNYVSRWGVTSFLINEVEFITGALRATELGVSHLADNIILLRYAARAGEVIKVVLCLKKRLGATELAFRELRIGPDGLQVGEKFQDVRSILTGVAEPIEPM